MSTDELAIGNDDDNSIECSIFYLHTTESDSEIKNNFAYYSDFCLNVDSDTSWDYWDNTDSVEWVL